METIITRTFKNGDEAQVNAVIKKSFNNPGANAYPFPPHRFIVVAEIGRKIIGHTSIRPLLMYVHGNPVRAGILHMVGTDPDYQEKGAGRLMMDKAIEIMAREKITMSLLKTPVPKFYEKKGWHVIVDRDETIKIPREKFQGVKEENKERIEVLDGDLKDLGRYVELRNEHGKRFNCFSWTNDEFMTKIYEEHASGAITSFFHEVRINDAVEGYFLGKRMSEVKEGEKLAHVINELVLNKWSKAIIGKILEFLFSFDEEFERVDIHCPVPEKILPLLEKIGTMVQVPISLVDMARVNLPERLGFASNSREDVVKWLNSPGFHENIFVNYFTQYFEAYLPEMGLMPE